MPHGFFDDLKEFFRNVSKIDVTVKIVVGIVY